MSEFGVALRLRSVTVRRHAGAAAEGVPELARRAIGNLLERMNAELLHAHGPDAR